MRCVLAVDAGGTKCDALYVREDGIVLGWGHVDAGQAEVERSFVGFGRDLHSMNLAIRQAMGDSRCEDLNIAGFSHNLPLDSLDLVHAPTIHLHKTSEFEPAFILTGEEVGVVIVAGTGAVAFGRSRDGRELRLDGLGPQLGDYGGGYQIGLLGLQAAARAEWHPRHQTSLAEVIKSAVAAKVRKPFLGTLIDFMLDPRDRTDIAGLARLVDAEARAGDRIAIDILHKAANDLAETVWDVTDRLGMAGDESPLIGLGSVARKSAIYWEHFCTRVLEFAPRFRFLRPELPPVVGSALFILQHIGTADPQVLRENLLGSVAEFLAGMTNVE